jgi:hypothetical protein
MMARAGTLLIALILLTGCEPSGPATVTGKVTFDGAPVKAGTVGFHPDRGMTPYYAIIQPDGTYSLTTETVATIPAGSYTVTVNGQEPPRASKGPPGPGKVITPQKYADKATSPLRASVRPGVNTIDLAVPAESSAGKNEEKPGEANSPNKADAGRLK